MKPSLILILSCIFALQFSSCEKEAEQPVPELPVPSAGPDVTGVREFQIKLSAEALKDGEKGRWSILSGLVDDKVYFENDEDPQSVFHGLPGETYELGWQIFRKEEVLKSSVMVSFKPLTTSIVNETPENATKFRFHGKNYDKGEWTIEGKYAYVLPGILGGIIPAALECPLIKFQGYANNAYKLTWTTYYGSKSASASLEFQTGNYLEREALDDLGMIDEPTRVKLDANGHVVGLDLSSEGIAWILGDTLRNPTIQSLVHLKKLNLNASATFDFPTVIGEKYRQLEYLSMTGVEIHNIPDNIGNLTRLKELYMQGKSDATSLPETIGNLKNLEVLYLNALGLSSLPKSIGKLEKLKVFNFDQNPVQYLPETIGNLKELEKLTGFTYGNLPASVSKLSNLKFLSFSTYGSARLPDNFGNLKSLEWLRLDGPFEKLPGSFTELTNLKDLTVKYLEQIPEDIGNLTKLKNMLIEGTYKTVPESLCALIDLETLVLNGKYEYLPEDIGNLKKLTWFSAKYGNLNALPDSFGQLENLETALFDENFLQSLPPGFFDLPRISRLGLSMNKFSAFSSDFAKLSNTLVTLELMGNSYTIEEVKKLKQLLPSTGIYSSFGYF